MGIDEHGSHSTGRRNDYSRPVVRAEFLQRNGNGYVDFDSVPTRDHLDGEDREQRILSASYDLRGPRRLSSLQ